MKNNNKRILTCILVLSAVFQGLTLHAQLKGDHLLGDFGLSAGTQPPPSFSLFVPLYWYDAGSLKNNKGDIINHSPGVTAFITAIGGSLVSDLKILGGNWGASLMIPFASNRLQGNYIQSSSPFAFSDIYLQPIQLGWHCKQADFLAGYAMYLPTGKYSDGASDNSGLGMWGYEFSGGTTVYFDKKKSWNISSIAFFEFNSTKKNSEMKVGNLLTVEGGLARTFYSKIKGTPVPMIINVGIPYYMQFKVSDDKIPIGNTTITGDRDRIYGLGLEANVFYPRSWTSLGIRWVDEVGARNRFQGNTFFITISQTIIKSFEKKGK